MEFNVNNIGKLVGTGEVSKTSNIKANDSINSVFTQGNKNRFVQNTPFSGEEQHILGIFASVQDNILIEE